MRITEVTIGKAMTFNLGNYESARVEVAMTADINEGDDLHGCVEALSNTVQSRLRKEFEPLIGNSLTQTGQEDK